MSKENKQPAAVRVCEISDIECSRGCSTSACKKEEAQPDERATQQATTGDERAAFARTDSDQPWTPEHCKNYPQEASALLNARTTTPSPVAGSKRCKLLPVEPTVEALNTLARSLGMEPLSESGEGGYPITGKQSTVRQAYDALLAVHPVAGSAGQATVTKEWCMKMAALEPEEGVPPAGLTALDNSTTVIPVSPDELAKLSTAPSLATDAGAALEDDDPRIIAASNRGYAAGLKDGKALGACGPLVQTSGAAREEQPSWTNPMTPYGMLVRALRIVVGTTLMDMATFLGCGPAQLSALEFGRKPVTNADIVNAAHYFASFGINSTTHALTMAARNAEIERQGGEA